MHPADEKPVRIFNTLIGINKNRIECYTFAGRVTNATTLRVLFSRLSETSRVCNEALETEVYKLGGIPFRATLSTEGFFSCWNSVHAALQQQDSRRLVEACSRGEEIVLDTYAELMRENEMILNSFQMNMLREHYSLLLNDAERVNNLCQVFSNAA